MPTHGWASIGAAPRDRRDAMTSGAGMAATGDGLVCPIVECFAPECEGNYVWPTSAGDAETLVCERCGHRLAGERLSFTRKPASSRATSDPVHHDGDGRQTARFSGHAAPTGGRQQPVAGNSCSSTKSTRTRIRMAHRSPICFADGARRSRTPPHVVGLSATLSDPAGFFSDLTGLNTGSVAVVAPQPAEMLEFGRSTSLRFAANPRRKRHCSQRRSRRRCFFAECSIETRVSPVTAPSARGCSSLRTTST